MTVGERIQQYRKNLNLSQEELGQRLLVSRQTVSQWETDQTMPTLDNMMRLKELFGVSIDTILSGENESEATEEIPLESYRFEYTSQETKDFLYYAMHPLMARLFRIFILYIITIVCVLPLTIISNAGKAAIILLYGVFVLSMVIRIIVIRVAHQRNYKTMQLQTYQYDLFRDHFSVRIFDDNRLSSYYDKPYHRIERIDDIRTFLMVQADHTLFCFRKPDLKQGSILFRLYRDKPYQKHYAPVYGMWKTLSILSFILAIVAHPMSIFLSVTVTSPSTDISAVWKTAIFLLFPIVSIVVGCILKSKGMVYKKNLVVGIIMTIVIALTSLLYLFVFTAFKNGLV